MYYHAIIETNEKTGKAGRNRQYFEMDHSNIEIIENRVVIPFLRKEELHFNGYFLKSSEIKRIAIKQTEQAVKSLAEYENSTMPSNILMFISPSDILSYDKYTKDITAEVFEKATKSLSTTPIQQVEEKEVETPDFRKIFIVHGRDDLAKTETARFIEKLGFEAVILHEQATAGKTIIEKLEEHTNVGFAVVLYTPCDIGGLSGSSAQSPRARQNVVFEHGYLIGKLGRQNVCALVKGNIEIPTDMSGVVYIPLDQHGAWHISLAKELRRSGYNVDMNKII